MIFLVAKVVAFTLSAIFPGKGPFRVLRTHPYGNLTDPRFIHSSQKDYSVFLFGLSTTKGAWYVWSS